jgi:hypothetical protein
VAEKMLAQPALVETITLLERVPAIEKISIKTLQLFSGRAYRGNSME